MSFPKISKNAVRTLVVPELSGGINLLSSASSVGDSQLTDGLNVWFSDGVLKSRPGIALHSAHINSLGRAVSDTLPGETKVFKEIKTDIGGDPYVLASNQRVRRYSLEHEESGKPIRYIENIIRFFWVGKEKNIALPDITITEEGSEYKFLGFFAVFHGGKIYCFTESKQIYVLGKLDGQSVWETVEESDIYVPTVLTGCVPTPYFETSINRDYTDLLSWGAEHCEDFNILGNSYKMRYSTYNPNTKLREAITDEQGNFTGQKSYCYMIYLLYEKVLKGKFAGQTVKAQYIDEKGKEYTHEVAIDGSSVFYEEQDFGFDGLKMQVHAGVVRFIGDSGIKKLYEEHYLPDNMVITAPSSVRKEKGAQVFNMQRSTHLGSGELFLCGNSGKNEKNLVVWSQVNNPLYFPENNCFYVGDGGSPVNGFGKQGDRLIIYKNSETYSTVRSGSASTGIYFPLTLINADIGCDLPDTVHLCRNRLVWAESSGKVYTLVIGSNSEYSIYEVSGMIERRLKSGIAGAAACEYEGYYVLLCDNHAYLFDYNSRGFQYVSSYQKNEDAAPKIPWYCWELGLTTGEAGCISSAKPCVLGDTLLIAAHFEAENAQSVSFAAFRFNNASTTDAALLDNGETAVTVERPFTSSFTTKFFEFGAQGYYKNVLRAVLSLGYSNAPLSVCFITDMGTEQTEITNLTEQAEIFSPTYIKSVQLNPSIRQVERFCIGLSSTGPLAVDGITLSYRITGGVR